VTWRAELTEATPGQQPVVVLAQGDVPDERGNVTRVHRLNSLPERAFIVHQAETAPDDEAMWARLAAPDFDPKTRAVTLDAVAVPAQAGTAPAGAAMVTVLQDVPGQLRLATESEAPGVLVVSEAYFPGWQARVNGAPVPLFAVDGALMGILLSAGQHQVELYYRPAALLAGAALSGLTFVLAVVLLADGRRLPGGPA
jgi:hypothetical protein